MALEGRAPKTQRGKRVLTSREPKLQENVKNTLLIKGPKASEIVSQALKDLHMLKKPHAKVLKKRNLVRPLEDAGMVEFLSQRNDSSLFAFASHTKKRPHNLILGRLYDGQILDMVECCIQKDTFKSIADFSQEREASVKLGMSPLIIFQGDDFENDTKPDFVLLKSLLLDMFRGTTYDKINLAGIDRVIVCTAQNETVYFRNYAIAFKKSGTKFPRVELDEIGPAMDWKLGRTKSASPEVKAQSMRTLKIITTKGHKTGKNIITTAMGDKRGRIHLEKQELNKIATKKMKGLKKRKRGDDESASTEDPTQQQPQPNEQQAE
jgi:ribosome production factor 2